MRISARISTKHRGLAKERKWRKKWALQQAEQGNLEPLRKQCPRLARFINLPPELLDGPKGFRVEFWTVCYSMFFNVEMYVFMLLVLITGPRLVSQDLRYNAIPLYLSRPLRRIDYFLGKLGVIAFFLAAVLNAAFLTLALLPRTSH